MLERLQGEVTRVNEARRLRKSAGTGLLLVSILSAGAWMWFAADWDQGTGRGVASGDATVDPPASIAKVVGNIDGVVEKYLVGNSDSTARLEEVSDDELLEFLAANGRPSILGKINGKTVLLPSTFPRPRAGSGKSQSL